MDALQMALLFDYYGELLTDRQRMCFDLRHNQDLSLAEIAQELNVSRQGVHDMIKRCDKILEEYEGKLHLVNRFLKIRSKVQEIRNSTDCSENIRRISDEILEEL